VIIDEGDPFLKSPREPRAMVAPRPACAECARLAEQGRAAVLTSDRSRLSDVWVLQERHDAAEHSGETDDQRHDQADESGRSPAPPR